MKKNKVPEKLLELRRKLIIHKQNKNILPEEETISQEEDTIKTKSYDHINKDFCYVCGADTPPRDRMYYCGGKGLYRCKGCEAGSIKWMMYMKDRSPLYKHFEKKEE